MMHRTFLLMIIALLFLLQNDLAASNDSFRCGSDLIAIGDTMHEVRGSCGEPVSSDIIGERNVYKILKKKKYKIESNYYLTEWIYDGNNGIYILTFEGSRLVKKEFVFQ